MLLLYIFIFIFIIIILVVLLLKQVKLQQKQGLTILTWNLQYLFTSASFPKHIDSQYNFKIDYTNATFHIYLIANMLAQINADICILQEVGGLFNLQVLNSIIYSKYNIQYNEYIDTNTDLTTNIYQAAILSKYTLYDIYSVDRSIHAKMPFLNNYLHIIGIHLDKHISDYWAQDKKITIQEHNKIIMTKLYPLLQLATQYDSDPNAYVMLAGDFNTFYGSNPLKIIDITKWINLVYSKKFEQGIHNRYTMWNDTDRDKQSYIDEVTDVDHIYVNNKLFNLVSTCTINHFVGAFNDPRYQPYKERRLSDHFPVIATIRYTI